MSETKQLRICSRGDVPPAHGKAFKVGKLHLALFNIDGHIHATSDVCTHEQESLSEGWLEGHVVECPRHGAQFDLRTGEALSLPATEPLEVFDVTLRGDDVLVSVPSRYIDGTPSGSSA